MKESAAIKQLSFRMLFDEQENCLTRAKSQIIPACEGDGKDQLTMLKFQTTAPNSRRRLHGFPRLRRDSRPINVFHTCIYT